MGFHAAFMEVYALSWVSRGAFVRFSVLSWWFFMEVYALSWCLDGAFMVPDGASGKV